MKTESCRHASKPKTNLPCPISQCESCIAICYQSVLMQLIIHIDHDEKSNLKLNFHQSIFSSIGSTKWSCKIMMLTLVIIGCSLIWCDYCRVYLIVCCDCPQFCEFGCNLTSSCRTVCSSYQFPSHTSDSFIPTVCQLFWSCLIVLSLHFEYVVHKVLSMLFTKSESVNTSTISPLDLG